MHLIVNLICINFFSDQKNTITECCSLWDDFCGNIIEFNVYKSRHSDVIIIKIIRVKTIPKKLPNTQYYWVLPIPIPNTDTSALPVAQ